MRGKRTYQTISSVFLVSVWLFAQEAVAVTVVNAVVPGTSNPWLAGMPDGSTASRQDSAPDESPVEILGLALVPGSELSFSPMGSVGHTPTISGFGPDGDTSPSQTRGHTTGVENGIADLIAPHNSLIGIFLGPEQPDQTPAPDALDFSTETSRDFATLLPLIKQPFYIGDGMTSGGVVQTIVVPDNTTRLFLGTKDGFGWFNNSGQFDVEVTEPDTNTDPNDPPGGTNRTGAVPEPLTATFGLMAMGAVGMITRRRTH